ncbi:xanthine dehydrogenase family protein molybdopterin-binding subunit [Marivibrio halodurans]|uniref:Xanthine dehydrogenase family protein molybdopterin-binding subunit n=1 Tax=Marivibrio halodurans TaxID=2039722 RepID=A0A8J7V271_9PROT|nr:xanthine dehydrogenase family protein molybdopterin-binding subunit [Marivibrio halodurans]MBP5856856.1 xanthine dehydrogenase family protein molybdopterin-binding subunit [Marivibrio halodurans]
MPLETDFPQGYEKRDFRVVGKRPVRPDGIDKVTGRARFGADTVAPGMLHGAILRSPHAHARIKSIDTAKAEALEGVKAVVTRDDFPIHDAVKEDRGLLDILVNCMAREKALYDGHAVAAVAATDKITARKALKLIEVEYEVLGHVIDEDLAMAPDAPILHDDLGYDYGKGKPSNVAGRTEIGHGDVDAGFAAADRVVERSFKTGAAHQGYIEPHACLANIGADGRGELWCCTQGHFMVRDTVTQLLGMDVSNLRVTASEIGGGFGGKTAVFIEPVAVALSRKAGKPVKIVMDRHEVFRATGPTASASLWVKVGAKADGTITAADALLKYQGGAFQGSPVDMGAMAAFACYNLENVRAVGYDIVTNRPKQAAYRAPGAPMAAFAVESVMTELADALGIDPIDFRLKNAARDHSKSSYGPTYNEIGLVETLEAAKATEHYNSPLGPNQGRGVACGFWFNFGGQTAVTLNVNLDGTAALSVGTPDIGGSRASMCAMAAEELGIDYDDIYAIIGDTASLGYNDVTDGSRATFASGLATIQAARQVKERMCARAARIWGIPEDAVKWEGGAAVPSGPNAGDHAPLSFRDIAKMAGETGGPIAGHHEISAEGAGPSFATHIVDAEIDRETGRIDVKRYTVVQDAGKAVHPAYVEGQFQGGAVQGIGWALNEEYIYSDKGVLENAGFLDYRVPVASDLPMIETVIVEKPNPGHPYGVRGVGETSIVPPMGAIANAVSAAAKVRATEIPMSPPRMLKLLRENESAAKAAE